LRNEMNRLLPDKQLLKSNTADLIMTVTFESRDRKRFGKMFGINMAKRKRNKISRSEIQKLAALKDHNFWLRLKPVQESVNFRIEMHTRPLLIGCKYNKYSRKISHSRSFGKLKEDDNVEDIIHRVLKKHIIHESHVMVSCGREDIDVLMLGKGRPAVFELKKPRSRKVTDEILQKMMDEVNNSTKDVQISDLKVVDDDYFARIKNEVADKDKSYRCVVWTSQDFTQEKLDSLLSKDEFTLQQWTPIRVLHRRPNLCRSRYVRNLQAYRLQANWFVVYLTTQAGAYIKEFIHSDRGRTTPSFGSLLGCDARITQLDVVEVHHSLDD